MMEKHELPEGWEVKKLGEVGKVVSGGTPSTANPNYWDGSISWITPADLSGYSSKQIEKGKKSITELGLQNSSAKLIPKGSVLFSSRAPIGYVVIAANEVCTNQGFKSVVPDPNTSSDYLYYFLKASKDAAEKVASGTTFKEISLKNFSELKIPLPPLATQQRIVAKIEELFSQLDNGIAQLKTAQAQLKVYRQAVLKWAFEGRLTNKDVKAGELPEGWKWVKLNDICQIVGGVTKGRDFKSQATIHLPYLRVANVQDGYLDLKEVKTIEVLPSDQEKYKLIFGDILYTEGGDKDKLGRGTIWKNEIENCIHQNHIFRARPIQKGIESSYIAYFSQTKLAKDYFFKHGKQTTNLASINLTILSNLPIPLAPDEEQHRIVQEIESRLSVCDQLEATLEQGLRQAEALRQSILKRAFEGRLVG